MEASQAANPSPAARSTLAMCTRACDKGQKSVWVDLSRELGEAAEAGQHGRHGLQTAWDALSPLYFPLENSSGCRRARFGSGHYFNFL